MTHTLRWELDDPGATEALGLALARLLRAGDVLALAGEMGAGKTTLVRAIAAGLGVRPALVSSPTFVVVNIYEAPSPPIEPDANADPHAADRPRRLVHVDAYRLSGAEDLDSLGWDRLFEPSPGASALRAAGPSAAAIEWPERIADALPAGLARLELTPSAPDARRAVLTAPAEWAQRPEWDALRDRPPTRCRVTGRWVPPTAPTWPFADERARLADLYGWMHGTYRTSRPVRDDDDPDGDSGDQAGGPLPSRA